MRYLIIALVATGLLAGSACAGGNIDPATGNRTDEGPQSRGGNSGTNGGYNFWGTFYNQYSNRGPASSNRNEQQKQADVGKNKGMTGGDSYH